MPVTIMALVCVVVLGLVGVALALPEVRRGQAETLISAGPDRVMATIKDVAAQPQWRKSVATIALTADGWTETTTSGETIAFRWRREAPDYLELAFTSASGYSGTWQAQLRPEGGATRVAVVEEARLPNPFTRVLAYLFFDPQAFARTYLGDLRARVEAS